jgi:alpha-D-ribose 1-methylphosphonate 5-triphosphate synthase subunit PhnH
MSLVFDPSRVSVADLPRGFAQPAHGSQGCFRAVLDAMARPGRVQMLPADVRQDLHHPADLSEAFAAVLLTLTDADTRVHWAPGLCAPAALAVWRAFGRFHTGLTEAADPAEADFAFTHANHTPESLLATLPLGEDETPQHGATLVIEAATLQAVEETAGGRIARALPAPDADPTPWVRLTGPGIQHAHGLAVGGLSRAFWRARQALEAHFPCGIDLLFTCGDRVAALPRSTRVEIDPAWAPSPTRS